ncbi:unnamed protein product [Penicillium glandicola]
MGSIIPSGGLVLITGVNGFLASHLALELVKRGYAVRGTVRSPESASWITSAVKTRYPTSKFDALVVPSLSAPGIMDELIKDVNGIAYVAADTSLNANHAEVIPPGLEALQAALETAARAPSVKRFVLTSSYTAAVDTSEVASEPGSEVRVSKDSWNETSSIRARASPPYSPMHALAVYQALKSESERLFWKFASDNKPGFVQNSVLPGFVIGPIVHSQQRGSTSAFVKGYFDDPSNHQALAWISAPWVVDATDNALLHLAGLTDEAVQNERLLALADPYQVRNFGTAFEQIDPTRQWPIPAGEAGKAKQESRKWIADTKRSVEILQGFGQAQGFTPFLENFVSLFATMATHTEIFYNLPKQHLSALETFWKLCDEGGLLARPEGLLENEAQDGLNDGTALLRYLRARRFDPHQSLKQFQQATTTHSNNRIPIQYNEIDVLEFETARFLYPHWCGRRTKEGLPICLFDFGHLNRSTLAAYERTRSPDVGKDTSMTATQRASIAHDYLTRFVFPLCTAMKDRPRPSVPTTSATYLVDLSTFTMKQGWDIKNYTSDIGQLLMMGYPEIIDRLFVLNAPSYFGWMWGIMRKWLDPGTVEKVVIVPATEMMATLTKYIDTESIPSRFGGEFVWEHGTPLDLDIRIQSGLEWKEEGKLPPGPMKWVLDESGRKTAVAVGSIDGVARTTRIAQVKVEDAATSVESLENNV